MKNYIKKILVENGFKVDSATKTIEQDLVRNQ